MVIPVLLNHKISGYNKNDIIIREANTNDAQEVSRIVYERNGNPLDEIIDIVLTDIETIRSNKKKAIALVICINQKIIAFSKCIHSEYFKRSNYTNLPKGWYLCDLKVMEKYRTNGIGKLLTLYRLNWISRRANKAFYYSNIENKASINLHTSIGFKKVNHSIRVLGSCYSNNIGSLYEFKF
jgi:ribosomal protein S18 acetylase RimI-like enzyme|tara:strand:- start:38 stop:583 length:546 start_codon:yes stop_codon:yes gene_type:complete